MAATRVVQRRRVRQDLGVERQVLALRHHRDPVVADAAADQDAVARPRPVGGDAHALGDDADAGGGDEDAVALAALDHLGVAGDDRRRRRPWRPRAIEATIALRSASGNPSSMIIPTDEIQRPGAGHRHVVDGAVDRQRADVAAGEEQGRDDEAVGGHHHPPGVDLEAGLVVALGEIGVVEVRSRTAPRSAAPSPARRRRGSCRSARRRSRSG